MSRIHIDYDNVRQQAKKMCRVEDDCYRVADMMKKMKAEIPNFWEGGSADSFQLALEKRNAEIRRIGNYAKAISVLIGQVARDFEDAENRIEDAVNATNSSFGGGGGGGRVF